MTNHPMRILVACTSGACEDGYVPDAFLVHGCDIGHGDYIILRIGSDGMIRDYKRPTVSDSEWLSSRGRND